MWYHKKPYISSGIYKGYKWCHSNNQVMSIKNARFKPQPSTPNANLCINEKHTFYGNLWQRGRDCTKIWKLWERLRQRRRGWTLTLTKKGSNIEGCKRIKILGQEKHTNRGSKLMNFDWLHLICAYSCACLHCINFLNLICMLVWCMLVVELEW